jgi:pimeloyl-ACP methyl ester carboxylesterase/DNA-binding CsgD family transcriptional regulator
VENDVRYCTTEDGVRIAYTSEGQGTPVVFCHFVYAFSLSHLVPTYDDAVRRIGFGHQLVRYDMRGSGLSQREVEDLSTGATRRDIEAVAGALNLESFAMLGAGPGGARAVDYAAHHPGRVAGLILYEAFPRLTDAFPRQLLQIFLSIARVRWDMATRILADIAIRAKNEEERAAWKGMVDQSITGDTIARLIEEQIDQDVTQLLGRIECPTLVCHSRNDSRIPLALGEQLAAGIRHVRLVPLDGDAGGAFSDPDAAIVEIQRFLREQQPAAAPSAGEGGAGSGRPLTPREIEILRLIATGRTSIEISQQLTLSLRTVGRHIANIYDKIGTRTRSEAVSYAVREGLTGE